MLPEVSRLCRRNLLWGGLALKTLIKTTTRKGVPKDAPRGSQDTPRGGPRAQKLPQNLPKMTPKSSKNRHTRQFSCSSIAWGVSTESKVCNKQRMREWPHRARDLQTLQFSSVSSVVRFLEESHFAHTFTRKFIAPWLKVCSSAKIYAS